jgi:hypothetical protein
MPSTKKTKVVAKATSPSIAVAQREVWLNTVASEIVREFGDVFRTHFGDEGMEHLKNIRVSTGFPSKMALSAKQRRIGECWSSAASADKSHHIFISPMLDDPVQVIGVLAHELVHAADDGKNKHKGPFTKAVRALGLEGKPTATVPGEEFVKYARLLVDDIGEYPHVALTPTIVTKPQKTYMLKVVCPGCKCIVRMTEKWLDEAGAPFCGTRSHVIDGERTDKRIRMEVEA